MCPHETTICRAAAARRSETFHFVADGSTVAPALLEARLRRETNQARIAALGFPPTARPRQTETRRWLGTRLVVLGERLRRAPAVASAAEAAAR
jgi:hypothetical protein